MLVTVNIFFLVGKKILAPLQTHINSRKQGGEYCKKMTKGGGGVEDEDDLPKGSQTRENRNRERNQFLFRDDTL